MFCLAFLFAASSIFVIGKLMRSCVIFALASQKLVTRVAEVAHDRRQDKLEH